MNAPDAPGSRDRERLDDQQHRASSQCGYANLIMGGVIVALSAGESRLRPELVGGRSGC